MTTTTHERLSLRIERPETHIAEVILLGPSRGNAMGPDFWREAPAVFEQLGAEEDLRAIIVRGTGKTFSTGLDIMGMAPELMPLVSGGEASGGKVIELGEQMQRAFLEVARCKQPVIAAIDGWCIGAGVELACACDFRIATAKAKFSLREVKLSMVPDLGGIQRLPYIVGEGHARQMALLGDDYPAEDALRMGLVTKVVSDAEALREEALALARKIAQNPPLAVSGVKRAMNARMAESVEKSLALALAKNAKLIPSRDFGEAIAALVEGRAARYSGS